MSPFLMIGVILPVTAVLLLIFSTVWQWHFSNGLFHGSLLYHLLAEIIVLPLFRRRGGRRSVRSRRATVSFSMCSSFTTTTRVYLATVGGCVGGWCPGGGGPPAGWDGLQVLPAGGPPTDAGPPTTTGCGPTPVGLLLLFRAAIETYL